MRLLKCTGDKHWRKRMARKMLETTTGFGSAFGQVAVVYRSVFIKSMIITI